MGTYKLRYKNRTFKNERVDLDGREFIQCEFEGCLIELERGDTELQGCKFKNCKLMLRGNAYKIAKIINMVTSREAIKILDMDLNWR
jgi:hypothetical protein